MIFGTIRTKEQAEFRNNEIKKLYNNGLKCKEVFKIINDRGL